jgi:hypothetical protein
VVQCVRISVYVNVKHIVARASVQRKNRGATDRRCGGSNAREAPVYFHALFGIFLKVNLCKFQTFGKKYRICRIRR